MVAARKTASIKMNNPPKSGKLPAVDRDQTTLTLWIVLALIAAVISVYLQATSFDFTRYDDNYFITENPVVQQGLSFKNLAWACTAVQNGTWQPITWLTHMFDCQVYGMNAGGHHLTNIIFHLISTILLFFLLRRVTATIYPSALVAALFALHPLHVESVAWVGERRDVLSTIWWILTMFAYVTWSVKGGTARYVLVLACFGAGLMSKPMLVSLPLILLLIDFWPLQRVSLAESGKSLLTKKNIPLLVEKLPLCVMAAGMGIIAIIATGQEGSLGTSIQYPWSLRIENALVTYVKYLIFTFWPVDLIPHYPYPASYPFWQVAGSCGILLGISVFCLKNLAKRPYLGVGWFWFILSMFPVIGLIQQGSGFSMADRYTYVPLIGIFIMLAWGGKEIMEKYRWPKLAMTVVTALVLLVCGVLSFIQTGHWRDTETLFSYTLTKSPGNHVALQQLGVDFRERGEFDKAYPYLEEDVSLNPENEDALANFGQLLEKMGRMDEAIAYHQKAIGVSPYNPELHLNLGQIQARMGDLPGAQASFTQALKLQPDLLPAHLNLGFTLFLEKKYAEATAQFTVVLTNEPQTAEAYNGLGLIAMDQGRIDEATNNFRTALRLNPGLTHARDNLQKIQNRQARP